MMKFFSRDFEPQVPLTWIAALRIVVGLMFVLTWLPNFLDGVYTPDGLLIFFTEDFPQSENALGFYANFIEGIHYHLGVCLDALGNKEGALAEFKASYDVNPENPMINYSLGLGYLKVNDLTNAIVHFEKALELNPNDLIAMNSLAVCYKETGPGKSLK